MNIKIEEQISALMDGELSDSDTHDLISTMQHDPELKKVWGTYHLISAALHNNLPDKLEPHRAQSLNAALASEPTVLAPRSVTLKSKLRTMTPAFRQIAGLAIAASVTAVAILSVQTLPQDPLAGNAQVASFTQAQQPFGFVNNEFVQAPTIENVAAFAPAVPFLIENTADQPWGLGEPAFEAKLNNYLNNHNQYSTPAEMQGVLPYARLVGHGQEQ